MNQAYLIYLDAQPPYKSVMRQHKQWRRWLKRARDMFGLEPCMFPRRSARMRMCSRSLTWTCTSFHMLSSPAFGLLSGR